MCTLRKDWNIYVGTDFIFLQIIVVTICFGFVMFLIALICYVCIQTFMMTFSLAWWPNFRRRFADYICTAYWEKVSVLWEIRMIIWFGRSERKYFWFKVARKKNYIHCNKTFPRTSSELAFRVSSENIQKKISASGFVTPVCATFTPLCNLYFRHAQHEASLHRGGESEDTGNRD